MKNLLTFITILFFTVAIQNLYGIDPLDADIVVAADGSGDFSTVQAAINAAPSGSDRRIVIFIKRGLYNTEKLIIPGDKINISLIGESREETILSYHIYDCVGGKCPAEDAALWTGDNISTSATLTILGNGFRAENMTIQNTAGPVGQAQAVTVRADKCVFIGVNFYGYQDTMYFWSDRKRSYFEDCLIVGRTDYIYGAGTVFFQSCEIRSWGGGWITAPSTYLDQPYGFVFNGCNITYALNSPRGGDDGELVRFGRPWHEYPKVAWLQCAMTEKINPQGWGDKWNMTYSDTSTNLHLYEYKNTGPGSDMSGRASWAGIKELTDLEALEYTVQKVMAGNDSWDPTAEAPLVQNYTWAGNGSSTGWLVPENWNPVGAPSAGQSAEVDGAITVSADGGNFEADLHLKNKAVLNISSNSSVNYLSIAKAGITSSLTASLNGKIATKDSVYFSIDGNLTLNSILTGVHALNKTGSGQLSLSADNSGFSGKISIKSGTLNASSANSLGKGSVQLDNGSILIIGNNSAFYPKARLTVISGALLQLNADITTSEFFIDGVMQTVGEYSSGTNSSLITGTGKIIVGRPEIFSFHRIANGNWDNPANFTPALLPLAGETVIVTEEIETTSLIFTADIILRGAGSLRLRGDHTSAGKIFTESGTSFKYNTSGTGMSINAPVSVTGNVTMIMESGSITGSTMTLTGNITASSTVTSLNNGKGVVNTGTLLLTGNNAGFTGIWDLTKYSVKYPSVGGYTSLIEGKSENAFGRGTINAGLENRVVFNHPKSAGDSLVMNLLQSAKAVLKVDVSVKKYVLNGNPVAAGEYSALTNPELYEGNGKLIVGESGNPPITEDLPGFPGAEGHGKYVTGGRGGIVIYVTNLEDDNNPGSLRYAINQTGARIILFKVSGTILLKSNLNISNGNVTIAGQTAPGDGITLRDYPVNVNADNIIIRFIRFRMGDVTDQEADALGGRFRKNIMIDHCSMSWSTDECVSFYQNENFSLQWCIISESLRNSVHDKGAHGYGGIWGGKNASFHHNLLAHHDSRNPRLGESRGDIFALTDLVDLRNNVIYNWKGNSCYGGEAMNVNIVNCYYKPGPGTTKTGRIVAIDKLTDTGTPITNTWGKFYINGNVLPGSVLATGDNWTYGVYNQFSTSYIVTAAEKVAMRLSQPLNPGEVTTHSAQKAYEKILLYGGASLVRDAVDVRIIQDLSTGTATFMDGGNGSTQGIIDTQSAVGGWPVLQSLAPPADTDNDGMPDSWESANSLSMNIPSDAQLKTVDGVYPNLEVYLNSLVETIISEQNKESFVTTIDAISSIQRDINVHYNNLFNILTVEHDVNIKNISIYSISGRLLQIGYSHQSSATLALANYQQGIYIVRVADENNQVFAKKITVY